MRLWHYKLIPYLPRTQLLAQWRELNSIFKKQNKHILINYVYEYDKRALKYYSEIVVNEMTKRGFRITNWTNFENYFRGVVAPALHNFNPFPKHHNDRYLIQCYYNLQEKYDRGQKDFSFEEFLALTQFMTKQLHCTF